MYKKIFIAGLLLTMIGSPFLASALGVLDNVKVTFTPPTPGANQDVTIDLMAYTMDLDSSKIIWYVNKDPVKQGVGEKSVVVQTGDFGTVTEVTAVIFTPDGRKIDKVLNLVPSEIDILWEAQTYTPPFYKGKALPTYKSLVRVSAIPRYGTLISDPKQYYYDWKYNRTQGVGRGLGNNDALFRVGYAGTPVPVSVTVTLPGESWSGVEETKITPTDASVILYMQAPLLGTQFQKAIEANLSSNETELTLRATPFFFSNEDYYNDFLLYTWKVGNTNALPEIDQTALTIKKKGVGPEGYRVNLNIDDPKHVLQMGTAATYVNFSDENR